MVGGRLASDRRVRDKSEVVTTGPFFLSLLARSGGAAAVCCEKESEHGERGIRLDDRSIVQRIMLNKGAVALPPPGSPGDACHRVLGDP